MKKTPPTPSAAPGGAPTSEQPTQALTVVAPGTLSADLEVITEPTLNEDFATARVYLQSARAMAQGAAAMTILLGCELKHLHKKHGIQQGGDRRSDQNRFVSVLKWSDIVKQELGISDDSARNYMALAEAAKSRIAEFEPIALSLLDTPLGSLPEIKRAELLEKTKELLPPTYTVQQLMWDWGVQRKPKRTGGHHPRQGPPKPDEPVLPEEPPLGWLPHIWARYRTLTPEQRVSYDMLYIPAFKLFDEFQRSWAYLPDAERDELDGWLLDMRNQIKTARDKAQPARRP